MGAKFSKRKWTMKINNTFMTLCKENSESSYQYPVYLWKIIIVITHNSILQLDTLQRAGLLNHPLCSRKWFWSLSSCGSKFIYFCERMAKTFLDNVWNLSPLSRTKQIKKERKLLILTHLSLYIEWMEVKRMRRKKCENQLRELLTFQFF